MPVFMFKTFEKIIPAESDECTVVPEFPLGSGLLLVVSVSTYVLFSRNPEKITGIISLVTNNKLDKEKRG